MRVAIYARVSTDDKGQDPLNQLLQLREVAAQQGWTIVREYTDEASGNKGERPGFKKLWADSSRRRFDVLLFWSLDRLTREGTFKTLSYLRRLTYCGVKFKSYTEPYIDSLGVFSEAIVGVIAAIAQQERVRMSERTKAGLLRARSQGRRLGRPPALVDMEKVLMLQSRGESLRSIAATFNVSAALLCKKLAQQSCRKDNI